MRKFELKLDREMFASDAHVTFGKEKLKGKTTHTYLTKASKHNDGDWASATILKNHNGELTVSGVFSSVALGGEVHVFPDTVSSSHRARRLNGVEGFKDIAVSIPNEQPKTPDIWTASQVDDQFSGASIDGRMSFTPNCYDMDSLVHVVSISIATDLGFYNAVNRNSQNAPDSEKRDNVVREVEKIVGIARPIYLAQMNVELKIQRIFIGGPDETGFLSQTPGNGCSGAALSSLNAFRSWVEKAEPDAIWHLLTDCHPPPGVVGAAYINGLCVPYGGVNSGVSSYSPDGFWLTFAHEVGHIFGAQHVFKGGEGGIMDYGSGQYNGVIQFHPDNRREMCEKLNTATKTCPYVKASNQQSRCGNGILEPNEACECLSLGAINCGKCVNCRLTDPKIECSKSDDSFVIRYPSTSQIASVDSKLVAHPDCCTADYKLLNFKSTCNNGRDVCSATGTCVKACWSYLYQPCEGFDDSGCIQKCVVNNICSTDGYTIGPPPLPVGAVLNGACKTPSGQAGTCFQGICKAKGAPGSTLAPVTTSAPVITDSPVPPKTAAPVASETPAPVETKKPTLRTSSPFSPTASPVTGSPLPPTVSCPDEIKFNICPRQRQKEFCLSRGCSWCPDSKKSSNCQASQLACQTPVSEMSKVFANCAPFNNANGDDGDEGSA